MPELPEVETIANMLRPALTGRTITAVNLLWARTLAIPTPEEFQARLAGLAIHGVGRRGKHLLIWLSFPGETRSADFSPPTSRLKPALQDSPNPDSRSADFSPPAGSRLKPALQNNAFLDSDVLIIHLRMSGDLAIVPDDQPPGKHCRLALSLDDGQRLAFDDPRKFGRVWLVSDPAEVVGGLGPEPLDESFTPAMLYQMLQSYHRQLKPLLLDQTFLAGLGNIYADESLHRAKLHPLACSQTVTPAQAETLWRSIRETLNEGIRRNGASIDWVYRGGDFQNYFRAYQRTGEPCPVCGAPIERITVGQRGTHFCPVCQPSPAGSSEERL